MVSDQPIKIKNCNLKNLNLNHLEQNFDISRFTLKSLRIWEWKENPEFYWCLYIAHSSLNLIYIPHQKMLSYIIMNNLPPPPVIFLFFLGGGACQIRGQSLYVDEDNTPPSLWTFCNDFFQVGKNVSKPPPPPPPFPAERLFQGWWHRWRSIETFCHPLPNSPAPPFGVWHERDNTILPTFSNELKSNWKWGTIPHSCFKMWGYPLKREIFIRVLVLIALGFMTLVVWHERDSGIVGGGGEENVCNFLERESSKVIKSGMPSQTKDFRNSVHCKKKKML